MTANDCATCLIELAALYPVAESLTWLQTPHPRLHDRMPIDCDVVDVLMIIAQLNDGAYT